MKRKNMNERMYDVHRYIHLQKKNIRKTVYKIKLNVAQLSRINGNKKECVSFVTKASGFPPAVCYHTAFEIWTWTLRSNIVQSVG